MTNKTILLLLIVLSILPMGCGKKKQPNMLLITVDTLRRDHLGAYGYGRNTSPFMDSLAKTGVMFRNTITPVPQTCGSHATLLTSLHPLTHGLVFNNQSLNEKAQSIAEVLQVNGYHTMGAVATVILSRKRNFSQGFDAFADQWQEHPVHKFKNNYQRIAESVNADVFKMIDEYAAQHKEKPFFIWVHYYDPHDPYIGWEHIGFDTPVPMEQMHRENMENYDREIKYTDDAIKALYSHLEQKGLSDNLVTCITADHGEQFGEHGFLEGKGHNDVYAENTHVPLIFHGPGIPEHKVVESSVSTMDVSSTLLGTAGLGFEYTVAGIDLLKNFSRGQKGIPKDRKHLIIGTQQFARAPQMLGLPYSFIFNADRHQKFWYIPFNPDGEPLMDEAENRFTLLSEKQVQRSPLKTVAHLPRIDARGLQYAVLRADVTHGEKLNNRLNVKIEIHPKLFTHPHYYTIPTKVNGTASQQVFEVIYPVTIAERISVHLGLKRENGTEIKNIRYAILPKARVEACLPPRGEALYKIRKTSRMWKLLLTKRKIAEGDEFFDLSKDILMKENLIAVPKLKPIIVKYKKLLYGAYKYYSDMGKRLLKGSQVREHMTEEDKKVLKSLGYL